MTASVLLCAPVRSRTLRALTAPERMNLRACALPVLPYIVLRVCRMAHITFSPAVVDPAPPLTQVVFPGGSLASLYVSNVLFANLCKQSAPMLLWVLACVSPTSFNDRRSETKAARTCCSTPCGPCCRYVGPVADTLLSDWSMSMVFFYFSHLCARPPPPSLPPP